MFRYYFKTQPIIERFCAGVIIAALVLSFLPMTALANETASSTDSGAEEPVELETSDETASSTPETTDEETEETASTTEETTEDTTTASSTEETTVETAATTTASTTPESGNENDGEDGGDSPDVATTTATSTSGTTGTDGAGGDDGSGADEPSGDTATSSAPGLEADAIPVLTDNLIGDDSEPEGAEITGGVRQHSRDDLTITTGMATAQGEFYTDANSNNVRSEYELGNRHDLDIYTFNATGSNHANVTNDAAAFTLTGENIATANGEALIDTGDAISAFNIANVINSNIVNSDGFIYLANQILDPDTSLDLQDFFFPEADSLLAGAADCNLLSCIAEDIVYNVANTNHATITNDAYIEAITGDNEVDSDRADIVTGDAYGAANVINVVNTNVIDSNYRLLTFNAIGDLDGDLILPTEELFAAFFGQPNGMNQLEHPEERDLVVDSVNEAWVDNDLDTYAESGLNDAMASGGDITTGRSESESNVLNKVNENVFGGDLMYLWIRVHGWWSGDVVGLPEGLAWEWTPDGVIIYNADAEVTPSEFLGYDIDSYRAHFDNRNDVVIENNINIDAISGRNEIDGLVGSIETGDTFASANVMNIANTNVVGANWTMAIINIMGDFDGNVSFADTDLTLTGSFTSADDPLGPGSLLTFTYTVANSSDKVARNVELRQALEAAHVSGSAARTQVVDVGDVAPGESKVVQFTAVVDDDLEVGTTSVAAVASVASDEGDRNVTDNVFELRAIAHRAGVVDDTGTTTDNDDTTSTSTSDTDESDDETTDDDSTTTDEGDNSGDDSANNTDEQVQNNTSDSGSKKSGGSSKKPKKKTPVTVVERTQEAVDASLPPQLTITKTSTIPEGSSVVAGQNVDYTIVVANGGGNAYDAFVYDTLRNPIGAVLDEQYWDLGTILPGEEITLEYTTAYTFDTPSGEYTNTASVEAFANPGEKDLASSTPLTVEDAVYVLNIDGVDLAVGNVAVMAYFPLGAGKIGALVAWETSRPAISQVFYTPKGLTSSFNPNARNYGYEQASFRFPQQKTKHFMILKNLTPGVTYDYRVHARGGGFTAFGGDYNFTAPFGIAKLTLAAQVPTIAGASVSNVPTTPTPVSQVTPSYQPAPAVVPARVTVPAVTTPVVAEPTPEPEPEPEPEPTPAPAADTGSSSGGVGGFVKKVFGFFR